MTMSSEERRRRVHSALKAQRQASSGKASYRNNDYDDTGAQGIRGSLREGDHSSASYRRPAGASFQKQTGSSRQRGGRKQRNSNAYRSDAYGTGQRRRTSAGRRKQSKLPQLILLILAAVLLISLTVFAVKGVKGFFEKKAAEESAAIAQTAPTETVPPETTAPPVSEKLQEAARLAAMYDYDAAIALLNEDSQVAADPEAQMAIAEYEEIKSTLVRQNINEITHVFFHILVVDPENAFDKSKWGKQAEGYNSLMTTIPEFKKMIQEMYDKGYVLVGMHDMAEMVEQEDGSMKMVAKDIMLPPGKKAMVMSEDDVCYYEYMKGAGYATKMIVGEDGKPTCVYVDENGEEHVGAYDLVPILDEFIEENPGFSYRGSKAILAFTGYNGILGYRTDETYDPSSPLYDPKLLDKPESVEAEREKAREVVKALKADGYELASHSWGHRDMGTISMENFKRDTDRWDKNVNQALLDGECDIIIFPKGADVADWRGYSHDNERFDYLYDKGFRYFCNVDSNQYWVQKGEDHLRQGRRPLDGVAMWNDIGNGKNKLSDLFDDVSAIFDPARPTPVPPY